MKDAVGKAAINVHSACDGCVSPQIRILRFQEPAAACRNTYMQTSLRVCRNSEEPHFALQRKSLSLVLSSCLQRYPQTCVVQRCRLKSFSEVISSGPRMLLEGSAGHIDNVRKQSI